MDRQEIIDALTHIIGDYLRGRGLDLIDLIYRYEDRDLFLRILVDKPEGGLSLDECAQLNNAISSILDEKSLLQQRYILEVSSPGIDRPLKTKNDFLRCLNRKVRFFLNESINDRMEIEGIILKIEEDAVYVDMDRQSLKIPLSQINKAKQVISDI